MKNTAKIVSYAFAILATSGVLANPSEASFSQIYNAQEDYMALTLQVSNARVNEPNVIKQLITSLRDHGFPYEVSEGDWDIVSHFPIQTFKLLDIPGDINISAIQYQGHFDRNFLDIKLYRKFSRVKLVTDSKIELKGEAADALYSALETITDSETINDDAWKGTVISLAGQNYKDNRVFWTIYSDPTFNEVLCSRIVNQPTTCFIDQASQPNL